MSPPPSKRSAQRQLPSHRHGQGGRRWCPPWLLRSVMPPFPKSNRRIAQLTATALMVSLLLGCNDRPPAKPPIHFPTKSATWVIEYNAAKKLYDEGSHQAALVQLDSVIRAIGAARAQSAPAVSPANLLPNM